MKNYSMRLEFEAAPMFEAGDPVMKRAWVTLQRWTHEEDGPPRISPECLSATEVENEVRRLKAELDEIARSARVRFRDGGG